MRIVHLVQTLGRGGLEILIEHIVLGQISAGHMVRVVCLTEGGETAERLQQTGVDVQVAGVGRATPAELRRLRKIILSDSPDILHLHALPAGTLGRMAGIGGRVRTIYHVHTILTAAHRLTGFQRWRERLLARLPGAIVAVSEAVKTDLVKDVGLRQERVIVHSGGVPDIQPIGRENARKRFGVAPDEILLASIASLTPVKGHMQLLEAFARVQGGKLLIAGEGPLRQSLEERSEKEDLAGRVQFLGRVPDPELVYAAADIALLCSWPREGLSLAMLEAARAGLPGIVTNVGGLPEAVVDGETGLVVPPLDVRALTVAIERMMADVEMRTRMGDFARARFLSRFELAGYLERLEGIYRGEFPGRMN